MQQTRQRLTFLAVLALTLLVIGCTTGDDGTAVTGASVLPDQLSITRSDGARVVVSAEEFSEAAFVDPPTLQDWTLRSAQLMEPRGPFTEQLLLVYVSTSGPERAINVTLSEGPFRGATPVVESVIAGFSAEVMSSEGATTTMVSIFWEACGFYILLIIPEPQDSPIADAEPIVRQLGQC